MCEAGEGVDPKTFTLYYELFVTDQLYDERLCRFISPNLHFKSYGFAYMTNNSTCNFSTINLQLLIT